MPSWQFEESLKNTEREETRRLKAYSEEGTLLFSEDYIKETVKAEKEQEEEAKRRKEKEEEERREREKEAERKRREWEEEARKYTSLSHLQGPWGRGGRGRGGYPRHFVFDEEEGEKMQRAGEGCVNKRRRRQRRRMEREKEEEEEEKEIRQREREEEEEEEERETQPGDPGWDDWYRKPNRRERMRMMMTSSPTLAEMHRMRQLHAANRMRRGGARGLVHSPPVLRMNSPIRSSSDWSPKMNHLMEDSDEEMQKEEEDQRKWQRKEKNENEKKERKKKKRQEKEKETEMRELEGRRG